MCNSQVTTKDNYLTDEYITMTLMTEEARNLNWRKENVWRYEIFARAIWWTLHKLNIWLASPKFKVKDCTMCWFRHQSCGDSVARTNGSKFLVHFTNNLYVIQSCIIKIECKEGLLDFMSFKTRNVETVHSKRTNERRQQSVTSSWTTIEYCECCFEDSV